MDMDAGADDQIYSHTFQNAFQPIHPNSRKLVDLVKSRYFDR